MRHYREFDAANYLESPEELAAYLAEAFETNDAAFIMQSLGVVARSKGMKKIADETDLSRETLYRTLSDNGNPKLTTLIKIMQCVGLSLCARPSAQQPSQ